MIHVSRTVIVEGKYDKIRLENVIDANIVTTGGFDVYGDEKKRRMLYAIAKKHGVIILTDSDRAGFRIRSRLLGFLPKENVVNLYIPQREGKEPRKASPSKDGFLGVEGISDEELEKLFLPYASEDARQSACITKADLYAHGLSGAKNSAARRERLCRLLDLPEKMSSGALLSALCAMFKEEEINEAIKRIEKSEE